VNLNGLHTSSEVTINEGYETHCLLAFTLVLHHVYFPSSSYKTQLFQSGLQFPLAAHTSDSDSALLTYLLRYNCMYILYRNF